MYNAKAVRITEHGGPEVLAICDVVVDDPGPDEIVVEVVASGLNRADLLQRRGLYPAPSGYPQDVPGLEYAGTVLAVGEHVTRWRIGDRVMGITGGGGMATHLVAHESEALPIPAVIDTVSAAAIPEVFLTAFDALFLQAALQADEHLLIHAVASGIGTAALQLAQNAGAIVHGTSRTTWKLERCRELGLEHALHVTDGAFAAHVSADVILDLVGGSYISENLRALAHRGRIITVGLMGGAKGQFPLHRLLQKRATWVGSVLRSRNLEEKIDLARRFESQIIPLFASQRLQPIVDSVLPIANIRDAHASMEGNNTFGKLVLCW